MSGGLQEMFSGGFLRSCVLPRICRGLTGPGLTMVPQWSCSLWTGALPWCCCTAEGMIEDGPCGPVMENLKEEQWKWISTLGLFWCVLKACAGNPWCFGVLPSWAHSLWSGHMVRVYLDVMSVRYRPSLISMTDWYPPLIRVLRFC